MCMGDSVYGVIPHRAQHDPTLLTTYSIATALYGEMQRHPARAICQSASAPASIKSTVSVELAGGAEKATITKPEVLEP